MTLPPTTPPIDSPVPSATLEEFPTRYARSARFTLGAPRTVAVAGDRVLFCRSSGGDDPVLALWSLDPDDGTETVLFDPATEADNNADLPPAERARRERARESAGGVVAYAIDGEGSTACFAVGGSLFITDLASGVTRSPEVAGSVFDPRLSPDGSAVAYVDGQTLRVVDTATGEPLLTRSDDDPLVSYGRAEFVAAEEMGRSRGYWWAPDSSALIVARVDESPVAEWWIADPAHPERPPQSTRYPAAGTANATVSLELATLAGAVTDLPWSDDGAFEYLADVIWSSERGPAVVRQTRDQRRVSIATLDEAGGEPTELHTITDDIWVELVPGSPKICPDFLLVIEDVHGARRLCIDGSAATGLPIQVRALVGTLTLGGDGEDADTVAVVSAYRTPTDIGLLAVNLTADEHPSCWLTPPGGVHHGVLGGDVLVVTSAESSRFGSSVTAHRISHETLRQALTGPGSAPAGPDDEVAPGILEIGAVIGTHALDPGLRSAPTFTVLGARELQSALFLPSWHDGSSLLPVIMDPYGGPHAQRVLATHDPHLVSRWLAEHGYAVLVTDGRGTPGRGPEWEREVHGNLADPVLDDQVAALTAACQRHTFLDPSRVGIRGWSFGGYLAALAVLRRPDLFHAAVAGAPVTAWGLYDTHYTERYLGHPDAEPEHYRVSDLFAPGEPLSLDRPLLLIHGLADDNVVAAHTLQFSTELLANGCAHHVMPLSGVTHMTPQVGVASYLLSLQLEFFATHLAPTSADPSQAST